MPSSVSGSSYYGNTKAAFGSVLVKQSVIRLSGLNRDHYYGICFFLDQGAVRLRDGKQSTLPKAKIQ